MSAATEAAAELVAALKTVEGMRYYPLGDAQVDPPALVLGMPRLTWEGYCSTPTSATFVVFVLVAMDDRAPERLWSFVESVSAVLDKVTDAVVRSADPGLFKAGNADLPSYEITVEMSLT